MASKISNYYKTRRDFDHIRVYEAPTAIRPFGDSSRQEPRQAEVQDYGTQRFRKRIQKDCKYVNRTPYNQQPSNIQCTNNQNNIRENNWPANI